MPHIVEHKVVYHYVASSVFPFEELMLIMSSMFSNIAFNVCIPITLPNKGIDVSPISMLQSC